MSFFRPRRRTEHAHQKDDEQAARDITHSPCIASERESLTASRASSIGRRISALSFITSKLSARTKRAHNDSLSGIGHTVDFPSRTVSRDSTASRTPSCEDIRMPALGRRASESKPAGTDQLGDVTLRVPEDRRNRCSSSPNPPTPKHLVHIPAEEYVARRSGPAVMWIPDELLSLIFSFGSRSDQISLFLVSKAFLIPALRALYETVDLRSLEPARVEQCISLLASKRSLAGSVHTFACNYLPSSEDGAVSFSTVTFAIAFNNMDQLRSLTIPRFDPHLLHHATFRLSRLCILSENITSGDFQTFLSWCSNQPEIASLSFPSLLFDDRLEHHISNPGSQPSQASDAPVIDSTAGHSHLYLPSHLMSRLSHFHGPASMAAMFVPGRPIESIVLRVHTTLYEGLKPSAIVSALTRSSAYLTHLTVSAASTHVDARTLERVLMSAGAELGSQLESLEIEWVLEDEVLYKQILSVLPRFRTLHVLRLNRGSSGPIQSLPPPIPTPPATPRERMLSIFPPPLPVPVQTSRPTTATSMSDVPLARERAHLDSWSKHCPTLRSVIFLSGAEWRCRRIIPHMMAGESPYAPAFRFVGFAESTRLPTLLRAL